MIMGGSAFAVTLALAKRPFEETIHFLFLLNEGQVLFLDQLLGVRWRGCQLLIHSSETIGLNGTVKAGGQVLQADPKISPTFFLQKSFVRGLKKTKVRSFFLTNK